MSELADYFGGGIDFSAGFGGQGYGTDGWTAPPEISADQHVQEMAQAVDAHRAEQQARHDAWNTHKYSIMTDAINRGISGPEYDVFINAAKNEVLNGTVNPASPNIISDVVNARSAQQLGDVGSPAGFLNNLLNEYGYEGLQTLSEKDPAAFDKIVANARNQNITLSNIPGVARSTAGTRPDSDAMYGLPTYTDKYNALMDGDFINDNRTGLIDMTAKDPLSYMPLAVSLLAGVGTHLGGVIGTYTDPVTGLEMAVNKDGEAYPMDASFSNPQPDWNENTLLNEVAQTSSVPAFDRNTALDQLIESTLANTVNPGITDEYFNSIIKTGILKRNQALGPDANQQQFQSEFGSGSLGQELLDKESGRLRGEYTGQVGNVFTGKAFEPITDDSAINNILTNQRESALGDIARFGARGNLSATGGQSAGQFISSAEPEARSRLEGIGESIRGTAQRDVDLIRDRALQQAGSFSLGDPFFDIAPFASERESFVQGRLPQLESGIREQLGAEQLFDPQAAISEAGATQGLVSGAPSFLDELAARGSGATKRDRGLSSLGSGRF